MEGDLGGPSLSTEVVDEESLSLELLSFLVVLRPLEFCLFFVFFFLDLAL